MATSRFFAGAAARGDPEDFYVGNENQRPARAASSLPTTPRNGVGSHHHPSGGAHSAGAGASAGNGGSGAAGLNGVHVQGGEPDDLPPLRPNPGLVVDDVDGTDGGVASPSLRSGDDPLLALSTPASQKAGLLFGPEVPSGPVSSMFQIHVPIVQLKNCSHGRYETNIVTDGNEYCWYLSLYYYGYSNASSYTYSSFANATYPGASSRNGSDDGAMSVFLTGHGRGYNFVKFEFEVKLLGGSEELSFKDVKEFDNKKDWGSASFLPHKDIHRYLNDNNELVFSISVKPVLPVEAGNSKLRTGMVGLLNQGATCYLNSLIQTLYHTVKLRSEMYNVDTSNDRAGQGVALELQRLFFNLQTSSFAQSTHDLTAAFGWTSLQVFTQQDVQELLRNLLDKLEERLKGTPQEKLINSLFCGRMLSYVRCLHVNCNSQREEDYFDIQLQVKGVGSVREAFEKYVETERLEGENQYESTDFGKQDADKGVSFLSFPPVLYLHLKRFDYDWALDRGTKINDEFVFEKELNLEGFLHKSAVLSEEEALYTLHSVLVHEGDVTHGHYYSFVRLDKNGKEAWYKFNDDMVSEVSETEAIADNFGGARPMMSGGLSSLASASKRLRGDSSAYMLVYCRTLMWKDVMGVEPQVPAELQQRFARDVEDKHFEQKKSSDAKHAMEVVILTMKDVEEFSNFGPRPSRNYYDADVCEWGERSTVNLGDARYVTVEQAIDLILKNAPGCPRDAVMWTSFPTLLNSRRIGVPLQLCPPRDLAEKYLETSGTHDLGFVLVDDSDFRILPKPYESTFLVREYTGTTRLLGARMVAVPLSRDDTMARLFEAVRRAFDLGANDIAQMGLLYSVKEPMVLFTPDMRASQVQHLSTKGNICLFSRRSSKSSASGGGPRSIADFTAFLRDNVTVEFRGLGPTSGVKCEIATIRKNALWSQVIPRLMKKLADKVDDSSMPPAVRLFLPAQLDPSAVPDGKPVKESETVYDSLKSTKQSLPRAEALGTLGLNGRVVVFFQSLPYPAHSHQMLECILLPVAVFAPWRADDASVPSVRGRWDFCADLVMEMNSTSTVPEFEEDLLKKILPLQPEQRRRLRVSKIFSVRDGVAHLKFDENDDLERMRYLCAESCSVYRNSTSARMLFDALVVQLDDEDAVESSEEPLKWMQVQVVTVQYEISVQAQGAPVFIPVFAVDTVGSLWQRALARLAVPDEIASTLRPACKESYRFDYLDVKVETLPDSRTRKIRLSREELMAKPRGDADLMYVVMPSTDKPKAKNALTIRSS